MPYVRIGGVVPNLLIAIISIITVTYGKLRAFWAGMLYGLVLEIMLPTAPYLSLATYTISAVFCAFVFADKSERQLQYERTMNLHRNELSAPLRTVLCAALNTLIYEVVNLAYIYLGGSKLSISMMMRGILGILLTAALTSIIMFPIRRAIFGKRTVAPILKTMPVFFGRPGSG